MASPFEIEDADIKLLSDTDLTHLLRNLLLLEAAESGLPGRNVSVPLEITIPDGGEDGRISWEEGPESTDYIPNRFTVFQVKATQMRKEQFAREVHVARKKVLKPALARVVDSQGCYVFFYGRTCNGEQKTRNIGRVREELKLCGVSDPDSIEIDIYGIDRIANWTNKFITAVMFVQECCGKALPSGLLSWRDWSGYQLLQGSYFENSALSQHIKFLRTHLAEEQHICRIEGLSGVGKTRLALEALRPSSNPDEYDRNALSGTVVYIDAGVSSDRALTLTRELVKRSIRAIIVADECDALLHRRLEAEITRTESKLSLLSLDYELSEAKPTTTIALMPDDLRDVVNQMLKSAYPQMSDFDRSRIAEMAEGFPVIANLLAEAHLNDAQTHVGQLSDDQLLDRLVRGRDARDEKVPRVLSACALFTQIGFAGDAIPQRNLVAQEAAGVSSGDFYRICKRYMTRGIIQSREGHIRLALWPLALSLARRWWSETPPEIISRCIERISGSELQEPFFRRLSKMDDVREVQEAVAELSKPGALFAGDLALSTDSGSNIAHYLCQVNPRAVMDLMKTECSNWGAEEWGRNAYSLPHLFWTLEKLLWWHTTFFDAASLLLDAISKSTEAASRQAEEHFVALFRINLPGTQSTLDERLRFLEHALGIDDEAKRRLIVRALGGGLATGRASRSGGIESQGSRKSQADYQPATNDEIFEYWGKCINHLLNIIQSEPELRELAAEELGCRIGGIVCAPMLDRLDNVVRDIAESTFGYWPAAVVSLNHFLKYDGSERKKELTGRAMEWVRLLTPTGVEDRLKLYVDTPDWSHEKDSQGVFIDLAAARAQDLADELSTDGFDWTVHSELLLTGEQRQAMPFGERLAQLAPEKSSLLTSVLVNLRGREPRKTNLRLPAGFLWATQQEDQIAFLDQLLADPELLSFAMPLACSP